MNRARDFLAGMEEKTAFRACVFAAILVLMAATMFLLNVHTPLQMDDYDYSFSWSTGKPLAGVADVLASQAAHYRLWGGRSVVHTLAQLFLYWGKGVFNIANTAAYMLLVLELYTLAKPKGRRFCWTILLIIHAALFTLVPFFGTVFLWLDGACNYLWGTALGHAGGGALAAGGQRIPREKNAGFRVALSGGAGGGRGDDDSCAGEFCARICLCLRFDGVGDREAAAPHYALYGRVCGRGIAGHADCPWNGAGASRADAKPAGLLLTALLSAYAMVASPELSDRSYTCVIALTLCALATLLGDMEAHVRALDAARLCALPLALFLLVYGGYQAVREVGAHEAAWKAQTQKIETAVQSGADEVKIASVESRSRFTMNIALENDAESWPNSTLSKWFGIRVCGE